MAQPIHIPRVNNNDDTVKIVQIAVGVGDSVKAGDLILEVETEKATVAIEAESDGYVLAINYAIGEEAPVGAVGVWFGATSDEAIPVNHKTTEQAATGSEGISGKAQLLLRQHNLSVDGIPRSGGRLTAADVENYIATNSAASKSSSPMSEPATSLDFSAPADIAALTPTERGMLATVSWQRDHAVATYLEIEYDPRPWEAHATAYAGEHRQLVSPLLALMAHRLTRLAVEHGANGTMSDEERPRRIRYKQVNLGFTIQAGDVLYFCVVDAADQMDEASFINRLLDLQRRAMGHRLAPSEMRGATVGFTSMARWGVRRHVPVLAPHTSLMVAHTAKSPDGTSAILGATYDHRVLSGFDAARLLQKLAQPKNV